ncbi:leucine-rich repeat extensin-like protein 5 [Spinacia oleracea]|uniref:Leucine-rich repeat extensin-like protein 5 n=1 Tax=Spinacia oleracea TaxID=3562 RepID=A0ABM3QXF7_SPIOL|nr:leucine-rich repeat extensin-like protein 5 [Spinacia oleracea]
MEQRINILQKENEALYSQIRSTASIATGSRFQYRRDTSGLNRRLDLDAAPDHPLHVPFGEPAGPILEQIREFDPLPNQPRSNPSWLPPPPTQPSSAGTSAAAIATTAARVSPSQVGMTTSTMMSVPASTPASRPLPPPMVTMSMPLPVTIPAQGPTPATQMPWDQLFSQQIVQPVVNLVTSAPGAPPSTHATQGTPPYMKQVVPQFTPHQPYIIYSQNTYYQHLQASLPETFSPLIPVLNNICENTNHLLQQLMTMIKKIPGVPTPIKEASLDSYADSPYADPIDAIDIPKGFSPPNIPMYDGTTDPRENILTYKQRIMTIPVPKHMSEASLCKGFGSTLIGPALKWLTSLPSGCITCFAHLDNMFNQQFPKMLGEADERPVPCGPTP